MLVTFIIIFILIIVGLLIFSVVAGVGMAAGQSKQRGEFKKKLTTMSTGDLEILLENVRAEKKHAEIPNPSSNAGLELLELQIKESEIILELRRQWQNSLNTATLEELEELYANLSATPKLLNPENDMRRKILKKIIDKRCKSAAIS